MELPEKLKDKHFLVCDDYESMRIMVSESLKSIGVKHITTAKSGNEGYQTLKDCLSSARPIEFVITDLVMENGSGIDFAKLIRADDKFKHLPILMVTSKAEVNFVLDSIKAGVNSYIVKPWKIEDLHKRIIEVDSKAK